MSKSVSRLFEARKRLGMTQRDVAAEAGVYATTYTKYESPNNKRDIPASVLEFYARRGINMNWLITGEGPMIQDKEGVPRDEKADEVARIMGVLEEEGKESVLQAARKEERIKQLEKKLIG